MEASSAAGKLKFTDCLRTILYEFFGEDESETYAYYQKYCPIMFKGEDSLIEFNPHYFKLHSAIRCFEYVYHSHEDIELFDIVHQRSGDRVALVSRAWFFEKIRCFYENEGRRKNSGKVPMSILYVSANILDYLYKDIAGSLFGKSFVPNEFAGQLERVYRDIKKKDYQFSDNTTVKEFFKDILEPLYPQLSAHDQNFFWRMFKQKESLSFKQKEPLMLVV